MSYILINIFIIRYSEYVRRCHRDHNMDWSPKEENAAKDVFMQINDAYLRDIKKGINSVIFEFPIIMKSDFRPSLGLPIMMGGNHFSLL